MLEVGSAHGTGLVAMGEGAFNDFAAPFSMGDSFFASDALAIPIDGFLFGGFIFPFSATAVGFADAGHKAMVFV